MLTTRYKARLTQWLEPCAMWLARRRISPNLLTLLAPLLGTLVCAAFLRTRSVVPFSLAMTCVGCLDGLDGAVARVSRRVTKFGSYLDAMADRYVESMVVLVVAQVTGYWTLSMVVMAGALLVSYAKARAAMEAPIANQEWPDMMERAERAVLFMGGLALSALVPWRPLGHDLFWWTLVVLAVLIHLTVAQRMARAYRLISERSAQKVSGTFSRTKSA